MFKKLKDKLAEEVKSSPQRIQQFAQAAQAAVTSASSSISDITNSDLFSIVDNDNQQPHFANQSQAQATFHDVSLVQPVMTAETMDYTSNQDIVENQRQRRLSNSSFASDVSFRLPSYETPSMYHLQSDMEVSASEAEERGFSSGTVSLDRVTKEQLYAAYRRTQERYKKYRTQYGDLARHYKLLERENAKARSVLVETQDKALRRISELREQCTLEQGAKAHLEKALRVDIEEKNMKIEALNTKITLLQNNIGVSNENCLNKRVTVNDNEVQLINLSNDDETKQPCDGAAEITALNNKIEKMEQLLNKYKESLKISKEKNSQIAAELQILSNELENKKNENDQLKVAVDHLTESKLKIQELNDINEDLQNKINGYDFAKTKELSTLETDLQKAQEETAQLQSKIDTFSKREEEYAISLAENKLSIHKELEGKEAEIKSLKDNLSASKKEIQSLNIVINDHKSSIILLEEEQSKLNRDGNELNLTKNKIVEMQLLIDELTKKCHSLEQLKTKADEEYKCHQLQMTQETAEKLAIIDRNVYLENRNTQLTEENTKKSVQISKIESEMQNLKKEIDDKSLLSADISEKNEILEELDMWKSKYSKLQSEIQEEREELVKLQSEIEKLLANHELIQNQNLEYHSSFAKLKLENDELQEKMHNYNNMKITLKKLANKINILKEIIYFSSEEANSLKQVNNDMMTALVAKINTSLSKCVQHEIEMSRIKFKELEVKHLALQSELKKTTEQLTATSKGLNSLQEHNNNMSAAVQLHETEKTELKLKIETINSQYKDTLEELNSLKIENQKSISKIHQYEKEFEELKSKMEFENSQHSEIKKDIEILIEEKQNLTEKVNHLENDKGSLNTEIQALQNIHKTTVDNLDCIQTENEQLINKTKDFDNMLIYIHKLEENINILSQENISLKDEAERISSNVKNLQFEINEVRKSHAEIETEKDHLNEIIEKLENNEKKLLEELTDKNTQTEDSLSNEIHETIEQKSITNIMPNNMVTSNDTSNEITESYNSLKIEYDSLKEDNKRLQSDIEGLQSYLSKISKENSILNDKLRELIATSEHTLESGDVTELKNEIETGKGRIDVLLRENTILIEENLELKDQLHSHNYSSTIDSKSKHLSNNESEHINSKDKYNNLLQANNLINQKLIDLEDINKSLNGNVQQVQEKNQKLRLSNEKLEQRLDEALVSLRHLHSLQENTELEYLRNILYEYLTGTGTHSVTLAKVLAAIVKFDDSQTQLVLQKEKERQGFLHQLGII